MRSVLQSARMKADILIILLNYKESSISFLPEKKDAEMSITAIKIVPFITILIKNKLPLI